MTNTATHSDLASLQPATPRRCQAPSILAPYAGMPLFDVNLEDFLAAMKSVRTGAFGCGRFTPPTHTAYLVDLDQHRVLRTIHPTGVRVLLRQAAEGTGLVDLTPGAKQAAKAPALPPMPGQFEPSEHGVRPFALVSR